MKNKALFTIAGAAVLAFSFTPASQAAQLLTNGTFETPFQLLTMGDHVGTVPTGWTIAEDATSTTTITNDSNLVRGQVTNGTGVTSSAQYLGICPDDSTGQQSLDGNGKTVYVSEAFTLSAASPIAVSADFGGRDVGSATGAGSFWQILNSANAVVFQSAANSTPATGSWVKNSATSATLPAGSYRFVATLLDPDMIDAASVTNVPEPGTLAAAGLGAALLGLVGIKRRRLS